MDRRVFLAGTLGVAVAACSGSKSSTTGEHAAMDVVSYGDDSSQFLELTRPSGTPRGTVIVIHGGFWKSSYDLSLGQPLVPSLVDAGWAVANLEYRRVGNGGGWPATFDDVHAGIDALAEVDGLNLDKVVTVGHSAGGHLAVWAAGRDRLTSASWNQPRVRVTAAISQAGVLDLRAGARENLGSGAVESLLGGLDEDRLSEADPLAVAPLDVPVHCVHATDDDLVPISQSEAYVDAATGAGGAATLTRVEGGHFVVIDPASRAWSQTLELINAS